MPVITLDELIGVQTPDVPPFRFRITHEERKAIVDRLKSADAPIATTPTDLAQLKLITRQGAWLAGRFAEPATPFVPAVEVDR